LRTGKTPSRSFSVEFCLNSPRSCGFACRNGVVRSLAMSSAADDGSTPTPLIAAIKRGDLFRATVLIKLSAKHVQEADDSGRTCLWFAVLYGHVNIVRRLLERSGGVSAVARYRWCGWSLLTLAAWRGHLAVCLLLLEYKAPESKSHADPWAAEEGGASAQRPFGGASLAALRYVEAGAPPAWPPLDSPLGAAAIAGRDELIAPLLQRGVTLVESPRTPSHILNAVQLAASARTGGALRALLSHTGDARGAAAAAYLDALFTCMMRADQNGDTALHMAARNEYNSDAVRLLLEKSPHAARNQMVGFVRRCHSALH